MRLINIIFSGETFFILFLLAGSFKNAFTFIPVDITLLFFLLSIFVAIKRKLLKPVFNKTYIIYSLIFFVFSTYVLLSVNYTSNIQSGLDKGIKFFTLTGWSYLGVFFLFNRKDSLKKFYGLFITVSLISSVVAVYNYFTAAKGFGFVTVFGSNYLSLGKIAAMGSLMVLMLMILNKRKNKFIKSLMSITLLGFMSFALIVSGARMPLIAFILVLPFILFKFFRIEKTNIYIDKRLKGVVVISFILFPFLFILFKNGYFDTITSRLAVLFTTGGGDSVEGRTGRYAEAIKIWSNNLIVGKGIGSFEYDPSIFQDYPHNIFLEVLSELGIVGFMLFFVILSIPFINYFVKKTYNPYKFLNYLCLMYLLLNSLVSGDLNDNRLLFTFMAICSASHLIPYTEQTEELKIIKPRRFKKRRIRFTVR